MYHLNDVNVKQEGEKHATLDLITTTRPFKKKLSIFKHFIKMNVVIFQGIWGNKSKKIPNLFNLFKSSLPILPNSLVTLLFENSCCFFLKTVFRDRHYRILSWSKIRMHMCGRKICSGNFIGAELCWASLLTFVGNHPSFTDEGGGAELRPLDTTGVDMGVRREGEKRSIALPPRNWH